MIANAVMTKLNSLLLNSFLLGQTGLSNVNAAYLENEEEAEYKFPLIEPINSLSTIPNISSDDIATCSTLTRIHTNMLHASSTMQIKLGPKYNKGDIGDNVSCIESQSGISSFISDAIINSLHRLLWFNQEKIGEFLSSSRYYDIYL